MDFWETTTDYVALIVTENLFSLFQFILHINIIQTFTYIASYWIYVKVTIYFESKIKLQLKHLSCIFNRNNYTKITKKCWVSYINTTNKWAYELSFQKSHETVLDFILFMITTYYISYFWTMEILNFIINSLRFFKNYLSDATIFLKK